MKQLLLLIVIAALSACGEAEKAPTETVPAVVQTQDISAKPYQILFFLNPNGRPCQMQDSILKKMGSTLTQQANLHYIPTTNPALAREMFNRYGVRALPTLIVLDAKGNPVKRFAPGIQSSQAILQAMGS